MRTLALALLLLAGSTACGNDGDDTDADGDADADTDADSDADSDSDSDADADADSDSDSDSDADADADSDADADTDADGDADVICAPYCEHEVACDPEDRFCEDACACLRSGYRADFIDAYLTCMTASDCGDDGRWTGCLAAAADGLVPTVAGTEYAADCEANLQECGGLHCDYSDFLADETLAIFTECLDAGCHTADTCAEDAGVCLDI